MGPREDPQLKADRERERALAQRERTLSTQQAADDLTTDYQNVYGRRGISLFQGVV
jgi:hypothetical protein